MDLADVGGNVTDGCHIGSMGGTWMAFVYGFGGLRDYEGMLSFRPQRPPEARASLRFSLLYRGRALEVEITPDATTYIMRIGDELVFRHEDEVVTLTHANATVIRPAISALHCGSQCRDCRMPLMKSVFRLAARRTIFPRVLLAGIRAGE